MGRLFGGFKQKTLNIHQGAGRLRREGARRQRRGEVVKEEGKEGEALQSKICTLRILVVKHQEENERRREAKSKTKGRDNSGGGDLTKSFGE